MAQPVVTVRGQAQLEAPPDLATVSCTVHRRGGSSAEVEVELAAVSHQLSEVVQTYAAVLDSHSTSGLHVSPVFGPEPGVTVSGYQGTLSTDLVVADFGALAALVFVLARIPGSQLDGPYWSLRRDNPIHRAVRLAAISEARVRAADYAAAFDATLLDLVEVSDLEPGFPGGQGRMQALAFQGAEDAAAFEFVPAPQTVFGQVTVTFTMTAPDLGGDDPA